MTWPTADLARSFAEMALARADSIALVQLDGHHRSFARLDSDAEAVREALQRENVCSGDRVALSVERSAMFVSAMLGALKAGAAYVPLDPNDPRERLVYLCSDSGVRAVLTTNTTQFEPCPALPAVPVANLQPGRPSKLSPLAETSRPPGELACVLYTSGSTGAPKGVAVLQSAIANLVKGDDYVPLGAAHRIGHFASTSFDASTFEIWGSLLHGGTLVIAPPHVVMDPAALASAIRAERVDTAFVTTALFNELAHQQPEGLRTMGAILFGGEAVNNAAVRTVLERGAPTRLLHVYGPTENTTFSTWQPVEEIPGTTPVPIGRPIANTAAYVLDENLQPVSDGETGELYLAGAGLALGYVGRMAQTAERFVANPFAAPTSRMYRTGDIVRRLADAALEFVGRIDHQVKIRGHRVELGEVEAALRGVNGVKDALVVPRGEGSARLLVAYVVGDPGVCDADSLRAEVSTRLPAYMVPSGFVPLAALPMSSNGKVDRKALPEWRHTHDQTPARSDAEAIVCAVFGEVLDVTTVGPHDDFFALGGTSLLASRALSSVRAKLRGEITLRSFLEQPTASAVAAVMLREQVAIADTFAPTASDDGGPDTTPLSTGQQRMWFLQQLEPQNTAYHFTATVTLEGAVDPRALERALEQVVMRHPIFRTTFHEVGEQLLQLVHASPSTVLPDGVVDVSTQGELEQEAIIARAAAMPFALDCLPLVRWTLLRASAQRYVLIHNEHHIIHDGWSFYLLLSDLTRMYNAIVRDRSSKAALEPAPRFTFADFVYWERSWLQSSDSQRQLAFWSACLADAPAGLDLPYRAPGRRTELFRGSVTRIDVPPPLATRLREFSSARGVSLFVVMLAGYVALLRRYTGQTDITIGSGFANRRRPEFHDVVGMFVNPLALRFTDPGDPTFLDLVTLTRQVVLDAWENQECPFEKVVEALSPPRDIRINPFFQTMFSFHDAPLTAVPMDGVEMSVIDGRGAGGAKVDLNLIVIPHSRARTAVDHLADPKGLTIVYEHNIDRLDGTVVDAMMRHYVGLLTSAVAHPEQRVRRLRMITPDERSELLEAR